jgi:hypothetical protein
MRSGQWSFVQQVHQQALYATISRSFQAQLHARALRFYEANGTAAKTPELASYHATGAGLTCAAMYYIFTAAVCAPDSLDMLIVWMQQWWVQFDRLDESERKTVPRVQVAFMSAVRGQEARQLGSYKEAVTSLLKSLEFLGVSTDPSKFEPWSRYVDTDKAPSTTERLGFAFNFQRRVLADDREVQSDDSPGMQDSPSLSRRASSRRRRTGGGKFSLATPSKQTFKGGEAPSPTYACSAQSLADARSRAYSACGRLLWTIAIGAKYWGVNYQEAWPELEKIDAMFMYGQSLYLCELGHDMPKIIELLGMMTAGILRVTAPGDEAFAAGREKSLALSKRIRRLPKCSSVDAATIDFWEAVYLWWTGKDMVLGAKMMDKCAADRVAARRDADACDAYGQAILLALIDARYEDAQRLARLSSEAGARSLSVQNDEMIHRQIVWVAALRGDVAEASRAWTVYVGHASSSGWRVKLNKATTEILCLLAERVGRVELVIAQLNRTNREALEASDGALAEEGADVNLTMVGHLRRSGVASVDATLVTMVVEATSLFQGRSSITSHQQPFHLFLCLIFAWYDQRAGLFVPDTQLDAKVMETLEELSKQISQVVDDCGGMGPLHALTEGFLHFRRNEYARAAELWSEAADVTNPGYGSVYPIAHALLAAEAPRLGVTPGVARVHEREARRLVNAFSGPRPLITSLANAILRAKADEDAAGASYSGSASSSSYDTDGYYSEYSDDVSDVEEDDEPGAQSPPDERTELERIEAAVTAVEEQQMRQLAQQGSNESRAQLKESGTRPRHQLSSSSAGSRARSRKRSTEAVGSQLHVTSPPLGAADEGGSSSKQRRRSVPGNLFRSSPATPRGSGDSTMARATSFGRHRTPATGSRSGSPLSPFESAHPGSTQVFNINCETAIVGSSSPASASSAVVAPPGTPSGHSASRRQADQFEPQPQQQRRVALVMVLRFGEKKRRVLVDDGMVVLDVLRDNAPSSIPLDRLTARLDGVEVSRSMRLSVLLERMGADGETEPELELVERVGDGW